MNPLLCQSLLHTQRLSEMNESNNVSVQYLTYSFNLIFRQHFKTGYAFPSICLRYELSSKLIYCGKITEQIKNRNYIEPLHRKLTIDYDVLFPLISSWAVYATVLTVLT